MGMGHRSPKRYANHPERRLVHHGQFKWRKRRCHRRFLEINRRLTMTLKRCADAAARAAQSIVAFTAPPLSYLFGAISELLLVRLKLFFRRGLYVLASYSQRFIDIWC